ncbi:MAG: hypothetical protein AAF666_11155 [Pseudomonadota bacterium]
MRAPLFLTNVAQRLSKDRATTMNAGTALEPFRSVAGPRRSSRLAVSALAVVLCQTGCTYSEVVANGEVTHRGFHLGLSSAFECSGDLQRVRTTMLGAAFGFETLHMGYRSSDVFCLPVDGCGAVFFVNDASEASAIRQAVQDLETVCIQSSS